ncbi:protein PIMREG-like [Scleropages formosus]|uniref:Uncharacterized protein n=2 Tax=Scleropages formosus TaxID=113540 RepID=A0A8C9R272_SCLFO|nr:protein PIMREG [Scleropages formosus]XP_029111677.1 protein PIMREG [Scleropages formosus]
MPSITRRAHQVLDESGGEASPEAPDRFRKSRSSSSLDSLRMSLRKRLPLKTVPFNINENLSWESLQENRKTSTIRLLTRSAQNSIGGVYQKLQKRGEERLVVTPCASPGGLENSNSPGGPEQLAHSAVVTPRRVTQRTPRSSTQKTPLAARTSAQAGGPSTLRGGRSRRQLVRMAALRSPFASSDAQIRRRQSDEELESLSSDLRKLGGFSRGRDGALRGDEQTLDLENYW